MYNKCINYSNSCCYMSDQKKFNKSFSFHRSMKVWNRPITTWLNIVWYCPKKCDNDILTIFWKWYDIRYHDISLNDTQSTGPDRLHFFLRLNPDGRDQGWEYRLTRISWCNYRIIFKISLKYRYRQNLEDITR